MKKRIINREFFTKAAKEVAYNLVGKFIYSKENQEEYMITKTESYCPDEKDYNGHSFCYGIKKETGEKSKTRATLPLFGEPGTWCVYGGQLLLSVTNNEEPYNVLIKEIKASNGKIYTTDGIAEVLRLYQKFSDSNYWHFHGLYSLSDEATLYLMENSEAQEINIKCRKRKNIKNDEKCQFYIDGE